jgi:Arc/MetJ-type ribon-helix-helix transcriptional regulator
MARIQFELPEDLKAKAEARAAETGHPSVQEYLQSLIEADADQPTLREILAPVHQEFLDSGMSETDLERILGDALAESRRERRARRGA